MFEKEIKFIADYNLNKVKSFGSFITFERLLGSSMHPAVIQYISAELDYLISEDRNRLLQDSVFDYSGPEIAKHFNLIAHEIKKSKEISFEDLKKLVIQAVSFNLNYLARPKWSLSKLIYNDEQNRSIEEIKLNLNYIYFYDYIKSIFLSYISKRKLTSLSITEFELILNKIDNELFANQPQKLVDYSLYSIAEFFNLGDVSKTKISVLTLELFLKEKNLMDYLFRLRKVVPEDVNQRYDVDDIKNIIYSSAPADVKPAKPEAKVPEKEKISEKEELQKKEEIAPEDDEVNIVPENEEDIVLPVQEENETELPADTIAEENTAEEIIEEKAEEKIEIEEETETAELENNDEIEKTETKDEIEAEEEKTDEEITVPEEEIKTNENEGEISEEEIEEIIPEQKAEEEVLEQTIEKEAEEKIEIEEETETTEQENNNEIDEPAVEDETEVEEPPVIETADEEKAETIIEKENQSPAPEIAVPEEEMKNEEVNIDPIDSLVDEDFLSLFSEEVKKIEENDADLKPEENELKSKTETEKKDDIDSFFDFEEETANLLRAFKETEDEMNSKDMDLFQDTSSKTEKAAMDLIRDFHDESDKKDIPPAKENNNKPSKRAGRYKEKKIRNILDSISNNDVDKIISNVFNDDKEDFNSTMEKLNECINYDEATEILKSVFVTYRVNPYTRDALTLTNSVANYFSRV